MNSANNDLHKYKLLECYVPNSHCNLRCEYCYVIQRNYRDMAMPKFRRTPEEIGRAFNPARYDAEYLFVNFCAPGETLLCKELPDIIIEVLKQGNVVLISNNGTVTPAIEKLISLPEDLSSKLIFGCSLHYKEFKKRNLLGVFTENIKKIAASPASFHVSFNLYEGYMDCLDEIKNYCMENFGAPPHIAIMRDQRNGMKLYDPIDLATYKRRGADFHSARFEVECDNFLVNRQKYFCYAGETSWVLDLATGNLSRCYCEPPYFNAYDNLEQKIPLWPVGRHCNDTYCINASYFIACGNIPEVNYPPYSLLRDRPEANWHKKPIRDIIGKKFKIRDRKPKSALLLGDSISLDYREMVKFAMQNVMDVYYPAENGKMAAYTYRALYEWWRNYDWPADMDFVYWNNGLWDTARIFGDDEPQASLNEYKTMIRRIYNRLRYLFPKARIIFATTTPVVEEYFDKEITYRSNEEIDLYNEAATQVVLECGGIVHDLHGEKNLWPKQAYRDSTHFTLEARKLMAESVCELLLQLMTKA